MHCLLCYVVVTLCSINMSTAAVFTSHGQPSKQMRLVWYIYAQRYRDHHDDEFIRRCERVRRQFILTSALCGLVMVSMIARYLALVTLRVKKRASFLTRLSVLLPRRLR